VSRFYKTTRENIGKRMAIVFVESKTDTALVNGNQSELPIVKSEWISAL